MVEFITETISQGGYLGVAILMLVENIFPPIPSELIMPFAGFVAARGEMSLVGVIIAGTIGSVLGTLIWYYPARMFGEKRVRRLASKFGRWLTLTQEDISDSKRWFNRNGGLAVFLGRLVPGIRTIISIPAGLVRMPFSTFLLLTTVGSALWVTALTLLGLILDAQYERIAEFLDPVSTFILTALVAWYVYRVATYSSGDKGGREDEKAASADA